MPCIHQRCSVPKVMVSNPVTPLLVFLPVPAMDGRAYVSLQQSSRASSALARAARRQQHLCTALGLSVLVPFQTTIQLSVASTLTTTIANPNPDIVPLTTQHHISATPDTPQRTHGSHRQAANGTVGRALPTDTASPRRSTRTARTPKTERTTAVKTRDTTATTDNARTYECRHRGVATVPSSI